MGVVCSVPYFRKPNLEAPTMCVGKEKIRSKTLPGKLVKLPTGKKEVRLCRWKEGRTGGCRLEPAVLVFLCQAQECNRFYALGAEVMQGMLMEITKARGFESLLKGILNKNWFRKVAAKMERRE